MCRRTPVNASVCNRENRRGLLAEAPSRSDEACKPGAVTPEGVGGRSSARAVADTGRAPRGAPQRSTRPRSFRTPGPGIEDCLTLHGAGFAVPCPSPGRRCALTAPFHPCLSLHCGPSAVCSLWHCPSSATFAIGVVRTGGRYPPPCPFVPGLSSAGDNATRRGRPASSSQNPTSEIGSRSLHFASMPVNLENRSRWRTPTTQSPLRIGVSYANRRMEPGHSSGMMFTSRPVLSSQRVVSKRRVSGESC